MKNTSEKARQRRKLHIRKILNGTEAKPRVYVYISNKFINVACANDDTSKVIAGMRTTKNTDSAGKVGEEFGKKLIELGYTRACFDRSGYKFGKRLTALVDGIRKSGISI